MLHSCIDFSAKLPYFKVTIHGQWPQEQARSCRQGPRLPQLTIIPQWDVGFYMNNQEENMLEVTGSAVENLKNYLAQNNIDSAVRIALMQGG